MINQELQILLDLVIIHLCALDEECLEELVIQKAAVDLCKFTKLKPAGVHAKSSMKR